MCSRHQQYGVHFASSTVRHEYDKLTGQATCGKIYDGRRASDTNANISPQCIYLTKPVCLTDVTLACKK